MRATNLRDGLLELADKMEQAVALEDYFRSQWAILTSGRRVVAASGYFNPLHAGHLNYLCGARELGDLLVVIVNNDDQVRLKGSRPFMGQWERQKIVKSLRYVDYAVCALDHHDTSVNHSLELLRPDVFANGGDVGSEADCREAETCRRLGIEMAFGVGGTDKIQSSSRLLARV